MSRVEKNTNLCQQLLCIGNIQRIYEYKKTCISITMTTLTTESLYVIQHNNKLLAFYVNMSIYQPESDVD